MISEENLKEITDKDGEIDELELLTLQDQEAARNTFFRRPKKSPHVSAGPGYIEYKTIEDVARITKIDEVVLHICANSHLFRFGSSNNGTEISI